MKSLIQEGLSGDNVKRLVQACNDRLDSDPVTYFILRSIFEKIMRRYWWEDHAVPPKNMNELESTLVPPIVKVIDASPDDRRAALEELIRVEQEFFEPQMFS